MNTRSKVGMERVDCKEGLDEFNPCNHLKVDMTKHRGFLFLWDCFHIAIWDYTCLWFCWREEMCDID
jgi:hypothetical protein